MEPPIRAAAPVTVLGGEGRRRGLPASERRAIPRLRFASMITSMHLLIYSDDAPATRAFLRDVIGLPFVEDAGSEPGWLIFGTGRSELGVHPTHSEWEGKAYDTPRSHAISFMCDDIEATMD